ncbi:MAG: hypothetical protein GY867_08860 [bacterium]|nr:hypothetical protein [bacterium]
MADIEAIKSAIVDQHQRDLPLMNVEKMREGVLDWLRQIKYPSDSEGASWEDCLRVYPAGESDKSLDSGIKIRITLTLRTAQNTYLISLMECLAPDSREVYILSAHVNWKETEKRFQSSLDKGYLGRFEDVLRARHTVWAQTFRESELPEALNSCALALLGHELVSGHNKSSDSDGKALTGRELQDAKADAENPQLVRRPAVPLSDFPARDEDPVP